MKLGFPRFAAVAAMFAPSALAGVHIDALGTMPSASVTFGTKISRDGSAIAGVAGGVGAVRWTRGSGWQALGTMAPGQSAFASGVSSDGSVIAGTVNTGASSRGFRWTSSGGLVDVGPMSVNDLSADGSTMVGSNADGTRATRYTGVGLQDLGFRGQAYGVSGDGEVVVGVATALPGDTPHRAFVWSPTAGVQLLGGVAPSVANAVSEDGTTVVGYQALQGNSAFRWSSAAGLQDLGLASGFGSSVATAVNGNGSLIVGHGQTAFGQRALIWSATTGMRDLHEYLLSEGADMTGWSYLDDALDVSSDGRHVLGVGVYNGEWQGFVAVIPAPSAGVLLTCFLCCRRRRTEL